jgi:hypothetical protein
MGLPAGQQRVLNAIEDALQASEPRLESMYAIFARLTRSEGGPDREQIRAPGWRARPGWQALAQALLISPLVAALAVLGLLVGMSATGGRVTCGSGSAASAAVTRAPGSGCPAQAGHPGAFLTGK